jgi:hypothetical protein
VVAGDLGTLYRGYTVDHSVTFMCELAAVSSVGCSLVTIRVK